MGAPCRAKVFLPPVALCRALARCSLLTYVRVRFAFGLQYNATFSIGAQLGMWHPPFNRAEASHVSIVCYQFEGIRCQAITRGHSDSVTSLYMEKNSGTTVHEVTLTTVASTQPSVTALDETNAIACYTRDSDWHLFCHSLHLEYG